MVFTKETWQSVGAGFSIYDCAIRSPNRQCFLMYEKQESPHRDPLPAIRFVFTYNDESDPPERYYFQQFGHFGFARLAFCQHPIPNYAAVDTSGQVFGYDKDRSDEEPEHPRDLPSSDLAGVVNQVVRIGQSIYTVGGPRRLHKRLGVGQWQDLSKNVPWPKDVATPGNGLKYMWRDASGFSESDIYVAGGEGDVMRFDGQKFSKVAFPSNELLHNVHCAGDGRVYIGGNMGSLYVGRENTWKKLAGGDFSVPWKDIAWFAGKLWCGSDYGLWTLEGDKLVRAQVPADVQLTSGAIDISPDGKHMLTAGPDGASLFDGKNWQVLFSRHDFE